jgi:hypothetical protein
MANVTAKRQQASTYTFDDCMCADIRTSSLALYHLRA